ncbi:c-di-GMP phosphodiesterase [Salipaludibacillus neizhouensis]|uniref:C-di-GMP phosphodiesterase n=1 Tax=Salipaludibacillus neizhouensis TaxID=885475 RepID=A0A3A9K8V2_9BACI|nr:HD-GYP domain-containing protein [Salipaludibacillus neizhouensis]RKL68629.1 c-di-GMP phosphodiesterase [Salipaludibacillus neizhouensis]
MIKVKSEHWDQSVIGRTLANDVISDSGHFLLKQGMVLTNWHLSILQNHLIEDIFLMDMPQEPLSNQVEDIFKHRENISIIYKESVVEVKRLFQLAISREVPSLQDFMKPFTPLLESVLKGPNIFLELRHIKGHDEYTYRHSLNVGLLSATIGKILLLPIDDILQLGRIGFLHDLGKMKVSPQILNKESKLSKNEFDEVKQHTIYGKEMIAMMPGENEEIEYGALCHHERLDGSGYPYGLKGDQIPFLSQIIAVADVYDAISSDRIYKEKHGPLEALDELLLEVFKGRFNSEIVIPFVEHILYGYIGNDVLLDNGTKGRIVQLFKEEIRRPLLKVGEEFIDLRKKRDLHIQEIFIAPSLV